MVWEYIRTDTQCSFLSCSPFCHVLHMKQKLPQHSSTQPRTQLANTICVFLWWLFIYSCAKFAYLSFVPKIKNYRIIMQANTTQHTNTKHKTHNKQHEPPPPYPPAALPSIPMATSTMASNEGTEATCESVAGSWR